MTFILIRAIIKMRRRRDDCSSSLFLTGCRLPMPAAFIICLCRISNIFTRGLRVAFSFCLCYAKEKGWRCVGVAEIHSHVKGEMNCCHGSRPWHALLFLLLCKYGVQADSRLSHYSSLCFLYHTLNFTHNLKKNLFLAIYVRGGIRRFYRIYPDIFRFFRQAQGLSQAYAFFWRSHSILLALKIPSYGFFITP